MAQSNHIPREFIDNLVERVDIVALINEKVPLKKAGKNYHACCPFHNEKTPSFTVSQDKQFYHCFGCGAHGNAISFLMEYEKKTFIEALKHLAAQEGVVLPQTQQAPIDKIELNRYIQLKAAAAFYHKQLFEDDFSRQARAYLRDRSLNMRVCKEFQIGYAKGVWDGLSQGLNIATRQQEDWIETGMLIKNDRGRVYDRFRDRVMFPIRNIKGRVIGFGGRVIDKEQTPKYLNSPETPLFHKSKEVYGLYETLQHERRPEQIVVVEGYMDVVALHQHGVQYAVATLGTSVTVDHLKLLFRYTSKIILCMDGDNAGKKAALRAIELAMPLLSPEKNLHIMLLPDGDDPDTLIRRELGPQQFKEKLQQSKSLIEVLIVELMSQYDVTDSQGKAQLLQAAKDKLKLFNDAVLSQIFIDELAYKAKFEKSLLKSAIEQKESSSADGYWANSSPKITELPPVASIARQILILILQKPSLVQLLPDWQDVLSLDLPGLALVRKLFEIIQNRPNIEPGGLIEYWRDTTHEKALTDMMQHELELSEEQLEHEFLSTIKRFKHLKKQSELDSIIEKSKKSTLSDSEKTLMKSLLQELSNTSQ